MSAVLFEVHDNTAIVRINRPDKKNAINLEIKEGFVEAWDRIDKDSEIRTVIIGGTDKFFAVGQDLKELSEYREIEPVKDLPLNLPETFGANVKKPVISAINGYCLGLGLLLVVNSDLRIAGQDVVFGFPEVKVGVPPGLDLPVKLARSMPKAIAMEFLLVGEYLAAEKALQFGFVNQVVKNEKVMETAMEYAQKINQLSPFMTKLFKEQYNSITDAPTHIYDLSKALAKIGRYSPDYKEGPLAFKEKRKPHWESE